MKRSKFSEEQVAYALREAEAGTAVGDVCRQFGISEATFDRADGPRTLAERGSGTHARLSRGRRAPMTTAPVEQADLPPYRHRGPCPRCGGSGPIRVHFDRDCSA